MSDVDSGNRIPSERPSARTERTGAEASPAPEWEAEGHESEPGFVTTDVGGDLFADLFPDDPAPSIIPSAEGTLVFWKSADPWIGGGAAVQRSRAGMWSPAEAVEPPPVQQPKASRSAGDLSECSLATAWRSTDSSQKRNFDLRAALLLTTG